MNPGLIGSIVTVIFFLLFVGIVWWAYHKDNKAKYDAAANLPFEEEDRSHRAHSEEKAQ